MAYDVFRRRQNDSDWSLGGLAISKSDHQKIAAQAAELRNKIDDVRYDIRKTGALVGSGVFALAGAIALVGVATIFRTSVKLSQHHAGR